MPGSDAGTWATWENERQTLKLVASVPSSKALVTSSDALVTGSMCNQKTLAKNDCWLAVYNGGRLAGFETRPRLTFIFFLLFNLYILDMLTSSRCYCPTSVYIKPYQPTNSDSYKFRLLQIPTSTNSDFRIHQTTMSYVSFRIYPTCGGRAGAAGRRANLCRDWFICWN